jgi:hypothetical protein
MMFFPYHRVVLIERQACEHSDAKAPLSVGSPFSPPETGTRQAIASNGNSGDENLHETFWCSLTLHIEERVLVTGPKEAILPSVPGPHSTPIGQCQGHSAKNLAKSLDNYGCLKYRARVLIVSLSLMRAVAASAD